MFAGFVGIVPVDLGSLAVFRGQSVGNNDSVLRLNHAAVSCHRDGRQHVVTCRREEKTKKIRNKPLLTPIHFDRAIFKSHSFRPWYTSNILV